MTKRRFAAIVSLDVVGYSRMMQVDSRGLLAALNSIFNSIIKKNVAAYDGRVVKLLGDGAILEFHSAHDAIRCAADIQMAMRSEPRPYSFAEQIHLRAGVHAGDVIVEGQDLFGDAVNIASRLQAEADPGGVLFSKTVASLAGSDLGVPFQREGSRRFKNIAEPIETLRLDLSGRDPGSPRPRKADSLNVRFCKSTDGQSLAWASVGEGDPIVKAANWIGHLELDWRNPGMAPTFELLSGRRRFVYYDARGNGLSDWEMKTISFDLMVDDLEAVFDAAEVEKAPILAISQGCAIAAAFAARRPERVSSIIMTGGYALGRAMRKSDKDKQRAEAMQAMMSAGWDDDPPSLRDLLAEVIVPSASREDLRQYAEDMKLMVSPENLGRYREVLDHIDVTDMLPRVQAPCLFMHCRGDRMQPIEQGRKMAAGLPNCRFVPLDSNCHTIPANDAVWPQAEREMIAFLEQA